MAQKDGGPAFPQIQNEYVDHPVHGYIHRAQVGDDVQPGMSLRDYLAAKALPAVVKKYAEDNGGVGADHLPNDCAIHAYRIADAMLAHRVG